MCLDILLSRLCQRTRWRRSELFPTTAAVPIVRISTPHHLIRRESFEDSLDHAGPSGLNGVHTYSVAHHALCRHLLLNLKKRGEKRRGTTPERDEGPEIRTDGERRWQTRRRSQTNVINLTGGKNYPSFSRRVLPESDEKISVALGFVFFRMWVRVLAADVTNLKLSDVYDEAAPSNHTT